MDRRVFLIKGYSNNENELNLSNNFISYYFQYFNNVAGGAYEENEICILNEPTVDALKLLISATKPQFAVIVFIGHGATQDDFQLFKINKNEIIKAGQLDLEIKKHLIIIESCRTERINIKTVDLTTKIPNFRAGGKLRIPIERSKSKEIYIKKILECQEGNVVCFACGRGEIARNCLFSQWLLQFSFNWHSDPKNVGVILPITTLMNTISLKLPQIINDELGAKQNPEILGKIDYPFVISLY